MLHTLLSFSQHSALKSDQVLSHYLDSLYFYQHSQTRKFKHSIQSLLTSLIKLGEFEFSASIISQLTKESISKVLPTKSSSHLSSVTPKTSHLSPISTQQPFSYIPDSFLQLHQFSFKTKADLAALILFTLLQHSDSPLSRKDIERLSQKYISLFPSLSYSSDWDSRYSSNRSRFCLFSNDFLKKATQAHFVFVPSFKPCLTYQLTPLGLSFANSISQTVSLPLAS